MNYGPSTTDVLTTPDNLGRPYLQQTREGPSSGNWDTVQQTYNTSGRTQYVSRPFLSTAGNGGSGEPSTGFTYDALGRYIDVTDSTGVHTGYTYNLNDTTVTVTPAPTGEHAKARQYEYDALGRLTSVCEMSTTLPGVVGCGQQTAQTGYITSYQYDPLGNLKNVSQSGQTPQRSFTYDGLSRMKSESNPETSSYGTGGTTTYTYDSDSTCGTASILKGNKVKRVDPATNVTCYAWDGLYRLTQVSYPSGPNTTGMPSKNYVYDTASFWGITANYPKGRLTQAYTLLGGSTYSAEAFSYNARGEATDFYEAAAHGGWYHTQQDYFANGVMKSLQGFTGTGTSTLLSDLFTYNLDGKGRPYGMVDSTLSPPMTLWTSTTYNVANQPTAVVPSAGGTESFVYDGNSGRMTQWSSTAGSNQQVGTLIWNANGTLQNLQINDDGGNSQNCSYGYDDLARIASVNCGAAIWEQNFSYDAFGNITKTVPLGATGISFNSGYGSGNHVTGFTYDGMGNVTFDTLLHHYTYDAEGRPISAAGVDTTFDPFGRATEQNRNGTYTQIVYSPSGAKFAFMNGTTVLGFKAPMAAGMAAVRASDGTGYFQHADWLGSSRFAHDGGGNVKYDRAYAPFGEVYFADLLGFTTNRDFTGQTEDTTLGLYDFPFRQQSQSQGRWLAPDPAGLAAVDITNPQTWNRYAYVANNPLNAVDPEGLAMCLFSEEGILFCGGYGGGGGGYGAGLGTPGYNPGYCGPWNASCADGHGYYGNTPEWVLTGHWSNAAMRVLMGLPANDFKPWDMRAGVVAVLRANNDCSSWFNQGQGSAADIMSQVPILLGQPAPGPVPGPDAWTSPAPTSPIFVSPNGRFYPDSLSGLPVGGIFQPGSSGARMIILLHEAAHKVDLIPSDAFSSFQSDKNTQTVMGHCAGTVP